MRLRMLPFLAIGLALGTTSRAASGDFVLQAGKLVGAGGKVMENGGSVLVAGGKVAGRFHATGYLPSFLDQFQVLGFVAENGRWT